MCSRLPARRSDAPARAGSLSLARPPQSQGGTMQKQQRKLIEALDRVEEFLTENQAVMQRVMSSATHSVFLASRARVVERMKRQEGATRNFHQVVSTKHVL